MKWINVRMDWSFTGYHAILEVAKREHMDQPKALHSLLMAGLWLYRSLKQGKQFEVWIVDTRKQTAVTLKPDWQNGIQFEDLKLKETA